MSTVLLKLKRHGFAFLVTQLFLITFAFGQTVTTDKLDYYPGDYVIITGSGWQPGEIVKLHLDETPTLCPNGHNLYDTADAEGKIYNDEYLIQWRHLGISFVLTATGLESGFTAQTTFTDAPRIGNVVFDPTSANACIPTGAGTTTVSFKITATRTQNGTVNGTYAIGTLPTGVTATITNATFNANGGSAFPPATVDLTIASTASPGNITISATCTDGGDVGSGSGILVLFAKPSSGTLTKNPNVNSVCEGATVSATATAGSGGTGTVTDFLEYRFDNGAWNNYTSGASLNTTGHTSVDIQTYRTSSVGSCGSSTPVVVSWVVNEVPQAQFDAAPNLTIACNSAPPVGTTLAYNNNNVNCPISGSVTGTISGSHTECGGTYTESWTFTDAFSRTINKSRTITVQPANQAQFDGAPNLTIACSDAPPSGTSLAYSNGATATCAISGTKTGVITGSHTSCGGTYTETWTFTDDCARTSTRTRTITVQPANQAQFDGAPNLTIACSDAPPTGTSLAYTNGATATCAISGTKTGVITGSHTSCGGTYTETWTFTDNCARTSTRTRTITVQPANQAQFDAAPNLTIACGTAPTGTSLAYTNGATATCAISGTKTGVITGSHTSCGGTYTETWTFTDNCDRTSTRIRTITVQPAAQAQFDAAPNLTIACGTAPTGTTLAYSNGATATCAISGTTTGVITGSHTSCGGTYTETWTFTDNCDRTSTRIRTITVQPAAQAQFDAAPNLTIACGTAPTGTTLAYSNGATATCAISGTKTGVITGSHTSCGGTYTETWTFTDDCDRTSTRTRTITVQPAAQAQFDAAPNLTIACSDAPPTGTSLAYTNGATATCAISGTKTGVITGSHTSCGGTYTETWTFTDNCARTSTRTRTITVQPAAQAQFDAASNLTIACGTAPTGTTLAYSNGATATCAISGTTTGVITGSHTSCGGTYTETWTFTDDCDRTSTRTRTITVQPAAQAQFDAAPNLTIACGTAPTGTSLAYTNGATATCAISGSKTGTITGSHTECGGSYTESWTFTDNCGRTSTQSRTITVEPAAKAEFASAPNLTIACNLAPPVGTPLSYTNGATATCAISGSKTGTITGSHTECGGSYTESWTFTDNCGRISTQSRTITVEPAAKAEFASAPNLTIACNLAPPVGTPLSYTNGATSTCAISGSKTGTITGSHTECGGSYTESWTFTDNCGRISTQSRTITVQPAAKAEFAAAPNLTIACNLAPPVGTPLSYTNGATATCAISGSKTGTITGSHTECGGSYTESWTFTDNCGRTSTQSRTITVEPAAKAEFASAPNLTIACNLAPPVGTPLSYTNGATATCAISGSKTGTITGSHTECGGSYTESWTFTDNCGRISTQSRTITVQPAAKAEFASAPNLTIACNLAPPVGTPLSYTNSATATCAISGSKTGTITGSHTECGGSYTESWTFTDNCGRISTQSRTITVEPAAKAEFAAAPNLTIACNLAPPVGTPLSYTNGATATCAISGSKTGTITGSHTECGGSYIESWTFTDNCGRTSTQSRTITVQPAAKAEFAAAPNLTIACNLAPPVGTPLSYTNGATSTCAISGSKTGTITGSHTECGGSYTESWTFTDNCGRTSTQSRTITVEPAAKAEFAAAPNLTIACNLAPPVGTPLSYTNGASSTCAISGSKTGTITGSHTECGGSYTESWTFTDNCGRISTQSRTITVQPAAKAEFAAAPNLTIACNLAPPVGTPLSYTNGATATCAISGSKTGTITGSHTECGGSYTESWTFTDNCGRISTQSRTITVEKAAKAEFVSAPNLTIACNSAPPVGTSLAYSNGAGNTATCTISGTKTGTITGSHTSCGGTYTESWTFTDNCGRISTQSRSITVEAATKAEFVSAPNLTIACNSAPPVGTSLAYSNGAGNTATCTISGTKTGTITGSHNECGGSYTESWTFTDNCGRISTQSRTITVEKAAKAEFVSAPNLTIACNSAPPVGTSLAYNNGSGNTTTCTISGTKTGTITGSHTECGGSYTESWTFTDGCGRTSTQSRTITVEKAAKAEFVSAPNLTISAALPAPVGTSLAYSNGAGNTPTCSISGTKTGTITGTHTACGGSYTESWTFTDNCGRVSTQSRTITMVDVTPPTATCQNISINLSAAGTATITAAQIDNGSTDACGIQSRTLSKYAFSCADIGSPVSVTLTVKDLAGNISTCTANVTVNDVTAPVITTTAGYLNRTFECSDAAALTAALALSPAATDNCGPVTKNLVSDVSTLGCGATYVRVRTWNFTDPSTNTSANYVQTITVTDLTAPVITVPANITVSYDPGDCGGIANYVVTAADNCAGAVSLVRTAGQASGTAFPVGTTTVTYEATDLCNNKSTKSFTVTVLKAVTTSTLTVSPTMAQYSDEVTFTVSISNAGGACADAAASADIFVGTYKIGNAPFVDMGEGNLVATLTKQLLDPSLYALANGPMAPGLKVISADILGINGNYAVTDPADASLTITKENARVDYTGETIKATATATEVNVTVTLKANIFDISFPQTPGDPNYDAFAGDIRNARVKFINRDLNTDISGWIPVINLVDGDSRVGTVSFNYPIILGSSETYRFVTIGIVVDNGGYYYRDNAADNTVITVYKPVGDFITGGGYIVPTQSQGSMKSDVGKKTNFGFNVKFNKKSTALQGNMNIIFRRTESDNVVHVYQIKANSMQTLGVNATNPNHGTAEFTSKTNITDITNPAAPIAIGGNKMLYVKMTDNGEPGVNDSISFVLVEGDNDPAVLSNIIYSSNWVSNKTQQMKLTGGNLVVHSGFNVGTTTGTAVASRSEEAVQPIINKDQFEVRVFGNPTQHEFSLITETTSNLPISVKVLDVSGRIVGRQDNVRSGQLVRFGNNYKIGTYFAEIIQGEQRKVITLIKQ